MGLSEKVYKGLKRGRRPNIIDEEDLLYYDASNKGEWEALVKKELEEEDYVPTEEDPDEHIIREYDKYYEEDENESTEDRIE